MHTHCLLKRMDMKSYMHQNADRLLNRSNASLLFTQARKKKIGGMGTSNSWTSSMDYMASRGCSGRKILPSR